MPENLADARNFHLRLERRRGSWVFAEGELSSTDITLKRGVDPGKILWDWRRQVVGGLERAEP
ncbi:MAG: hypothetical protein H0W96_09110 [Solirubrobacterales bacterium]|nr:hypothetical protein [Solirubrobacterales bacterium]